MWLENHAGLHYSTGRGREEVHLVDGFGPYVTVASVMLDDRQDEYCLGKHQNFDVLIYIGRVQELRNLLTDNPSKPRKGRESPQFMAVSVEDALDEGLKPSELPVKTGII